MPTILLHSSKTMTPTPTTNTLSNPFFIDDAQNITSYICSLSSKQIAETMKISEKLSADVLARYQQWGAKPTPSAAVECFRGDIYSGLRALKWTRSDQEFAQKYLLILSGLYGILRPYDAVSPYRLEAAYKLPDKKFNDLYSFWGQKIAASITGDSIINLTSLEYTKMFLPHMAENKTIISPKFLTLGKDGKPAFIVVHAKIARGAFARWIIKNKVINLDEIHKFNDLGYTYSTSLSTAQVPVYICKKFRGIGLSQRQK